MSRLGGYEGYLGPYGGFHDRGRYISKVTDLLPPKAL